MRILIASLLALLGSLAGAPAALADIVLPPPAPKVEVSLAVEKPLSLAYGPGEKQPHLAGKVVATIKNASDQPVKLRDLQEHGFVFVAQKGGELSVLVHSCKCVKDVAEPAGAAFELAPGKEKKVAVDDWGCGGGSWPAPPPGRYRLEYRVLAAPAPEGGPPAPGDADPKTVVPACRKDLTSNWFWEGAARSKAIEVELKAPPKAKAQPAQPK
ncbi:MAG TPA: hypothetical protein VGK67_17865 [Myxococcales bacterium]|jgi:hypothetical protein